MRTNNYIAWFLFTALAIATLSCEKEYSYEGGNFPPPVIIIPVDTTQADTVVNDPGSLPHCNICSDMDPNRDNSWSFRTNQSLLCGEVDTAFALNLERGTITFFGPSWCGNDTGLIFTVSLGVPGLTQNIQNLVAGSAIFYFYHTNQPYVLLSHAEQPFTLIITGYDHRTRIATGTFSGTGYRADGRAVPVSDGKFRFSIP